MKRIFVFLWFLLITTTFAHSLSAAQAAQQDDIFGGDNVEAVISLAEAGDVEAQMALAQRYRFGAGVPLDSDKAVEWFQKAAEQGDVQGQFSVGYMYATGESGFEKDPEKAAEWFLKAAENGHTYAQANLGRMYIIGDGVEKNTKTALFWLQKSVDQGNAAAKLDIDRLHTAFDGVPDDIERLAASYKEMAKKESANVQSLLALKYINGDGVERDIKKAIELYQEAADQGNVGAQVNLAIIYAEGILTRKNLNAARELYLKAAEQGQSGAQYQIGLLYYNGNGVKKDRAAAAQWFQKAANQRHIPAQEDLGQMYIKGEGVKKDEIEGLAWLYLAERNRAIEPLFAISNIATLENKLGIEKTRIARRRSEEIRQFINSEISARTGIPATELLGDPIGSGAGVFISKDGLILTSARVVAGAESIKIRTVARTLSAEILEIDMAYDIAILKCECLATPAPVASSGYIRIDQDVFAILSPRPVESYAVAWTTVKVQKLTGARKDPEYLQIGRNITPGIQMTEAVSRTSHTNLLNSVSGPLLDGSGNLIGMIPYRAMSAEGFTYVLRSEALKPLLEKYGVEIIDNLKNEAGKTYNINIAGLGMSKIPQFPQLGMSSNVMILAY